jgi:hypothetical protein
VYALYYSSSKTGLCGIKDAVVGVDFWVWNVFFDNVQSNRVKYGRANYALG